jgi:uncharacterized protein involved in exopolysaccharide biosynthesis
MYRTPEGLSFDDYAKIIRDIYIKDVSSWTERLQNNIYIRNIDRFKEESQYRIDAMERNRRYNLELANTYNKLLASLQQKATQGVNSQGIIVSEAGSILTSAQSYAERAANLQRQIEQMKYQVDMLRTKEPQIRANSREAETALAQFVDDLNKNYEKLYMEIFAYYRQIHKRASENSVSVVVYSKEEMIQTRGVSTTWLLMLLIGLTFVGFVVGLFAAFIKKYIPGKEKA